MRRAFTLIELLVVVAIIALLISILVPSLVQARRQTKHVVCGSNLHQIGLALSHYAQDNRDYLPSHHDPYYPMVWAYGGQRGTYDVTIPPEQRPLNRYLFPEYYRCPLDKSLRGFPCETFAQARGLSYPLNGYNCDYPGATPYMWLGVMERKWSQITNPKCILTGDSVIDEYWSANSGYGFRWHDERKPMANVVFPDASVRYVLMTPENARAKLFWWEGKDYSFNPTLPNKRTYRW